MKFHSVPDPVKLHLAASRYFPPKATPVKWTTIASPLIAIGSVLLIFQVNQISSGNNLMILMTELIAMLLLAVTTLLDSVSQQVSFRAAPVPTVMQSQLSDASPEELLALLKHRVLDDARKSVTAAIMGGLQ